MIDQAPLRVTRRTFLAGAGALAAAALRPDAAVAETKNRPPVVLFTKHLAWMGYEEMADTLARLGFDGADLTVRPRGHVLPENAARDLPKAAEAVRKAGLDVFMITTGIEDADSPTTEPILRAASDLGIRYYRIGDFGYDAKRPVLEQLKEWNEKLKKLADLNAKYNIAAGYHNHSGLHRIGGPIWDLHAMLQGIDPRWIGSNYDIGHAVLEGSGGAWVTNFRLIAERIKMSAIKDCAWTRDEKQGWQSGWVPVGEGMVDWKQALGMMKAIGFTGPFSMHFEYDVPGESEEERHKNELAALRRDLDSFRGLMKEAGWV